MIHKLAETEEHGRVLKLFSNSGELVQTRTHDELGNLLLIQNHDTGISIEYVYKDGKLEEMIGSDGTYSKIHYDRFGIPFAWENERRIFGLRDLTPDHF